MNYTEGDLVRIARRQNNQKRTYLVVDPLQGKHIPVQPSKALILFTALADTLREAYCGERLLLIGFAETATAIGAQAAISLGARYMQTTREAIPGVEYLFFSEEHSHASEQRLVRDDLDRTADEIDRIVFIEDEVTTGNTILNIVRILKREYPGCFSFAVASLLNGMTGEHLARYEEHNIPLHYLVKTDHSGFADRAGEFAGDGTYYMCTDADTPDSPALAASDTAPLDAHIPDADIPDSAFADAHAPDADTTDAPALDVAPSDVAPTPVRRIRIPGRMDARRMVDAASYQAACESLWDRVSAEIGPVRGERLLVVGTEEFMFPALYVGSRLEAENAVWCHSTTRSPIEVSTEETYPLHSRYELKSLYDPGRTTYLYDIASCDRVLVLTDAQEKNADRTAKKAGKLLPAAADVMLQEAGRSLPEAADTRREETSQEAVENVSSAADAGETSLLRALRSKNKNITVIRWC